MNLSISEAARRLRIPFTRLYNAQTALGVSKGSEIDSRGLTRLTVEIQQNAVPFGALAAVFGPDTTLEQMAEAEEKLVREKYKEMWEKYENHKVPKGKGPSVEFLGDEENAD